MFTGKNKEQFEKWYNKKHGAFASATVEPLDRLEVFYILHPSMQSGVYLEYLDSVGCYIEMDLNEHNNTFGWLMWFEKHYTREELNTRQEALTEAFKKADELINKQCI